MYGKTFALLAGLAAAAPHGSNNYGGEENYGSSHAAGSYVAAAVASASGSTAASAVASSAAGSAAGSAATGSFIGGSANVPGYTGADAPYASETPAPLTNLATTFGPDSTVPAIATDAPAATLIGNTRVSSDPTGATSHGPFSGTATTMGAVTTVASGVTVGTLPPNPTVCICIPEPLLLLSDETGRLHTTIAMDCCRTTSPFRISPQEVSERTTPFHATWSSPTLIMSLSLSVSTRSG